MADHFPPWFLSLVVWSIVAIDFVGVVGNIHKRRWSFLIWIATSILLMGYNYIIAEYAQTALWGVYTLLSAWGYIVWSRDEHRLGG